MVQLPPREPREGGRLESDRIIMADGTAIDLFDENDDKGVREKAHKRSRERQDEVGRLPSVTLQPALYSWETWWLNSRSIGPTLTHDRCGRVLVWIVLLCLRQDIVCPSPLHRRMLNCNFLW